MSAERRDVVSKQSLFWDLMNFLECLVMIKDTRE